jgi:hypothetical protein
MAELSQGLVFLNSPGVDGLREAIVSPAEMAGYKFEDPAIVEDMLHHLATTQGALPLLQFAASKLWDARDAAKHQLTRAAYESIGGVAGALASHANAVLEKLSPSSQPLMKSIFLRLVTPDRTRAIVEMGELRELSANPAEVQSLVDELVQARLLTVQTGGGAATVEIVHESLIHSWPQLKRWLEETGEDAAFLEQLRTATRQWTQKGHDEELLWRGELAHEADRFSRRFTGELPASQREFLNAVINLAAKKSRNRRLLTLGAIGFLTLLLAAASVALVVVASARSQAQDNAEQAQRAMLEAKQNLAKAEKKEQERAAAQQKAEQAASELQQALKDANDARAQADLEAERATRAAADAKRSAKNATEQKQAAEKARSAAEAARKRADELAKKAEARAKAFEAQVGGAGVIDELK